MTELEGSKIPGLEPIRTVKKEAAKDLYSRAMDWLANRPLVQKRFGNLSETLKRASEGLYERGKWYR